MTTNETAMEACRLLKAAYDAGKETEHVDWNDVDRAHEMACKAVKLDERGEHNALYNAHHELLRAVHAHLRVFATGKNLSETAQTLSILTDFDA